MEIIQILRAVNSLPCYDDLLRDNGLSVINTDILQEGTDALKVGNSIFIRDSITDESYRKFLVLHEVGHHILHDDGITSFYYKIRMSRSKNELEANTFACLYLIRDENLEGLNIIEYLSSNGVPKKVATKIYDHIMTK